MKYFTAALCASLFACTHAMAANDETIVYGDDMSKAGETGFEMYSKWSRSAPEQGRRQLFHAIGEMSYGLTDQWNLGLKLPVTREAGQWHADGAYLELKYLAPHAAQGWYWGAEIEGGSVGARGEERAAVLEVVPLVGWHNGAWHALANPGFEYTNEGSERGLSFSPRFKVSYQVDHANAFGMEYHVDAGLLKAITPRHERNEVAFLTWEAKFGEQAFSVALGHGATSASERWALRLTFALDD
ncbi:MAG: hypothetical protein V4463_03390 [Pseudomonadota bacterium]